MPITTGVYGVIQELFIHAYCLFSKPYHRHIDFRHVLQVALPFTLDYSKENLDVQKKKRADCVPRQTERHFDGDYEATLNKKT